MPRGDGTPATGRISVALRFPTHAESPADRQAYQALRTAADGVTARSAPIDWGKALSAWCRPCSSFPSLRHLAAISSRARSPVSSACSSQRLAWWKHSGADSMDPSTVWAVVRKLLGYRAGSVAKLEQSKAGLALRLPPGASYLSQGHTSCRASLARLAAPVWRSA